MKQIKETRLKGGKKLSKYSNEEKLSNYIDALNNEQEPEVAANDNDQEFEKLMETVQLVRTLREPTLPDEGYPKRLAQNVAGKIAKEKPASFRKSAKSIKGIPLAMTALAAGLLMFVLVNWLGFFNQDVVYAMEKAVAQLNNYHGVLEMRTRNAAGEEWLVRRVELWSEADKYAIKQDDGTLTVNNGQQEWQINHEDKKVILLPLLPDTTGNNFDLRDEAKGQNNILTLLWAQSKLPVVKQ